MTQMLDHITTIDYSPSGNLKGQGVGANWIFLLPRLNLQCIVCIGVVPESILQTLKLFSDDLICIPSMKTNDIAVQSVERIPTSSVDLIFICDTQDVKPHEIKRILKADGLLYYEYYGRDHVEFALSGTTVSRFWLTPTFGDMQTAVGVGQKNSIGFIRYRKLYTSTIRQQTLERLRKNLIRGAITQVVTKSDELVVTTSRKEYTKQILKRFFSIVLRYAQSLLIRVATQIEQILIQNSFTSRWTRRYGVLVQNEKSTSGELPRFLQSEAEKTGIDIRKWEWSFVAKGDFSSQKLLFYLFHENEQKPSLIVKLVRDPQYNERLEREYRGLNYFDMLEFDHRHTIPQVKFHGYHHGLFFVAESVLDGQPFTEKSTLDSQCEYARFAVQWLIDLGITSRTDANGAAVAALLMPLYERFVEIYKPDASMQQFFKEHLDHLGCASNIPLVFRHGDPGLQNLLVTSDDVVAFLDWENAELKGMPLWDVFHFFSAYCIKAGQVKKKLSALDAYEHFFLNKSSIQPLIISAVDRYCESLDIDRSLIQSLYYVFWMYRSLKQSTMVNSLQLQNASTWRILRLSIDKRDSPTLQALV